MDDYAAHYAWAKSQEGRDPRRIAERLAIRWRVQTPGLSTDGIARIGGALARASVLDYAEAISRGDIETPTHRAERLADADKRELARQSECAQAAARVEGIRAEMAAETLDRTRRAYRDIASGAVVPTESCSAHSRECRVCHGTGRVVDEAMIRIASEWIVSH